jgi:hypothetical protein
VQPDRAKRFLGLVAVAQERRSRHGPWGRSSARCLPARIAGIPIGQDQPALPLIPNESGCLIRHARSARRAGASLTGTRLRSGRMPSSLDRDGWSSSPSRVLRAARTAFIDSRSPWANTSARPESHHPRMHTAMRDAPQPRRLGHSSRIPLVPSPRRIHTSRPPGAAPQCAVVVQSTAAKHDLSFFNVLVILTEGRPWIPSAT